MFLAAPLGFSWPPSRNNTLSHPLFASCARVGRLVGRPPYIRDIYVFRTNVIPCARVRCIHRKSYDVLPATGSSRFPPWLPRQRLKNRKRAGGGSREWRNRVIKRGDHVCTTWSVAHYLLGSFVVRFFFFFEILRRRSLPRLDLFLEILLKFLSYLLKINKFVSRCQFVRKTFWNNKKKRGEKSSWVIWSNGMGESG